MEDSDKKIGVKPPKVRVSVSYIGALLIQGFLH